MTKTEILERLELRFNEYPQYHEGIVWEDVEKVLTKQHIESLINMEEALGEPNVVKEDEDYYYFFDTLQETPEERGNITYDQASEDARKKEKLPIKGNAQTLALNSKTELLNEDDYLYLQSLDDFDLKTSVWLQTPEDVRKKGGALFGDKRYGRAFIYHNGAKSFYKVRGYRTKLKVKK